jgi:hypothetical protein
MKEKVKAILSAAATLLFVSSSAWAQENGRPRPSLGESVVSTLIFGVLGIVLAIGGFKLFDMAVKQDIQKEVFEKGNLAAAILGGAVILGIAVIVAATLLAP